MSLLDDLVRDIQASETLGSGFVRAVWPQGAPQEGRSDGRFNAGASFTRDGILDVRTLVTESTGDSPAAGVYLSPQSPLGPTDQVPTLRFGDLFPRLPTRNSQVAYVRELIPASLEGGASAVAEGGTKPEATIEFEGGRMPVGKFAVSATTTQEILDDVPALHDFVGRRMVDMLRVREEAELLNGDGTGANITGLRNTPGIQTLTAGTTAEGAISEAIDLVQDAYGTVDAIALGTDVFRSAAFSSPTFLTLLIETLGIRVVVMSTRAIGVNRAMVGAFATGATIRERSTMAAFSTEHGTNFTSNKVTLVSERREALVVNVPAYFCDLTVSF